VARSALAVWGGVLLGTAVGLAACHGCHGTPAPGTAATGTAPAGPATLRIYAVSNLAGALEPCGCTKDQLGGIDHLAALIAREKGRAGASLLVAAGPTMFLDPKLEGARATQDEWKAEAIGESLGEMGLAAWTPGYNDWAGGEPLLASLAGKAKGPLVAANLEGAVDGAVKTAVRDVGGVKVGIVGVSVPARDGAPPAGVKADDASRAMKSAVEELRAKGARIFVGLAALPRGEALRVAEAVPDLTVLVTGKPVDAGEANDAAPPPTMIGGTLVVGTSNHLQTVAVVDLFVRGGDYKFKDGSGIANQDQLRSLTRRIEELEHRIAAWEKDGTVRGPDLEARKADLTKLKEERTRLANPVPPAEGSFFRYELVEIREKLGSDPKVQERMLAFYKRVNEHNKSALAGRKPPELAKGQSGYVGVEVCSSCHEQERKVWDRTAHAHAYETLSKQFKEYNLECVSCHVTGYEKPGGATVTVNASLRDVQCEQCHGPGQAHAKKPDERGLIAASPKLDSCVSSCHHPPHVEGFDPEKAKEKILGPGHGMPDDAPWPAWAGDGGK
jgi:2',3'-cyclic-nucleotide 2'-phosphodiesterase (5'-nucleotidase family)